MSVSKNGKDEGNSEGIEFKRKVRGVTLNKRRSTFRIKTIKIWIRSNDERNIRDYKNETTFSYLSLIKTKRQRFGVGNKQDLYIACFESGRRSKNRGIIETRSLKIKRNTEPNIFSKINWGKLT